MTGAFGLLKPVNGVQTALTFVKVKHWSKAIGGAIRGTHVL